MSSATGSYCSYYVVTTNFKYHTHLTIILIESLITIMKSCMHIVVMYTGSPSNVRLTALSSHGLNMTWDLPVNFSKNHGSFVAYTIRCLSRGQLTVEYTLGNITQATIDECLPYQTYNCCVSLHTTLGNSTEVCKLQRTLQDGNFVVCNTYYLD